MSAQPLTWRTTRALMRADRMRLDDPTRPQWRLLLTEPGYLASTIFRLQAQLHGRRGGLLAYVLRSANLMLTGVDIVPGAVVGPGLLIRHPVGIVIGYRTRIGADCTLLQGVTLGERHADGRAPHDYPTIGDGVTIGAGASVLGGVRVGHRARIAASAVVLTDVPDDALAVGIPARIRPGP